MSTPVIHNPCAPIVISGRREDAGQALAAELRALGVKADFQRADVRIEHEVRDLIDKTIKHFGRRNRDVTNAEAGSQPHL